MIVITAPEWLPDEPSICNSLFLNGLEILHLRKPGAPAGLYEKFIKQVQPRYHNRIVVHEHYELAEKYLLRGIHLKSGMAAVARMYPGSVVSISCHSVEEIRSLPFRPVYCFLSPVFDSISKPGYGGKFGKGVDLSGITIPVIALGGITPRLLDECRLAGFSGVATLGYIWERPEKALSRFIQLKTPFVMSLAGFDPSSGAGITADLKTFESTGSYGLGVCTAITFQNEETYEGTQWISPQAILRQCELQFREHRPAFIKIGLAENFDCIATLVEELSFRCPGVKIIWDPILKSSSGYVFHWEDPHKLREILKHLYLITPNTEELYQLFGEAIGVEGLREIAREYGVHILWKGGHNGGEYATDCLISPATKGGISRMRLAEELAPLAGVLEFSILRSAESKHGTGCILSAALVSYLAQGHPLHEACGMAQGYVDQVIVGNESKLGFHHLHLLPRGGLPRPNEQMLQYITAPKAGVSLAEQVEAVCRGGARWVQLRMKGASVEEFLKEGLLIKEICRRYGALFIVNDQVAVARKLNADGVHLGKEDMDPREARAILGKGKIIGATCNDWADIQLRERQQVDYIGLGPFAFTTTKEKLSPVLGPEGYSRLMTQMARQRIRIPVFAIGGIGEADIPSLMQTGIQGIALSGLIKNSDDLAQKTTEILKKIHAHDTFKNCR